MEPKPSHYRPDIDGLRAIAVTAVLIFHALPGFVPGGYVGVDIFFVLSGYLITGLLVEDFRKDRYSVLEFYVRRAKRLFPALLLVLSVVLAAGWLILLPGEFEQLGKHVFGGAAFISNILLWRESGYFDGASELKVLLHLWSLGVEEQYYLLWPWLLLFLLKRKVTPWWAVTGMLVLSAALSVALTPGQPAASFYLPATRFWELLAGSMLALHYGLDSPPAAAQGTTPVTPPHARWVGEAAAVVGLGLLVIAISQFDRDTPFPGWAAAVPVLGTVLLVGPAREAALNRWMLASRPFVWVGLISYPLYLWHWPLLAYARIWTGEPLSSGVALGLLAISVVMAWLTYRWIERPIRVSGTPRGARRTAAWLWVLLIALGLLGWLGWRDLLLPRSEESVLARHILEAQKDWHYPGDARIAGDVPQRVLFIGDSHMQGYWPSIERLMKERTAPAYTVEFITEGGCAPFIGVERQAMPCHAFALRAFAAAAQPDVVAVVFAASWFGVAQRTDYHLIDDLAGATVNPFSERGRPIVDAWGQQLGQLVRAGKRVVVVTSSPRGDLVDPTKLIDRRTWIERDDHPPTVPRARLESLVAGVDARVRGVAGAAGAVVLSPFDELCSGESCPVVGPDQQPVFIDESHLRAGVVRERVHMFDRLVLQPAGAR